MQPIELHRVLGRTESVCPECLARVPAVRIERGDDVYLRKRCPEHGATETIVWRGRPAYRTWARPKVPAHPVQPERRVDRGCPLDCGLCPDHRQQSCCVLLEVTLRCDLRCPFCFASAGTRGRDPDLATLETRLARLMDAAGPVNLQLSGGEPCVRDDLPVVAAMARAMGFPFIQVNSNGLRLGRDPVFARRLRDSGVATVFLQFDGTRDAIHERTRGRALMAAKRAAIRTCGEAGLGVVLVPVVIPGVNDADLGEIVRFGLDNQPTVRGVHFQPVSYFGRYPSAPTDADRITLPEIIARLEAQTDGLVRMEHFQPAGAENAMCSFNGNFVSMPDGSLVPLTRFRPAEACCAPAAAAPAIGPAPAHVRAVLPVVAVSPCCGPDAPETTAPPGIHPTGAEGDVARARDFVARNWAAAPAAEPLPEAPSFGGWDVFLQRRRSHGFCISGMAFQDAWTMDLDRVRDCHIHVARLDGATIPFCAFNLTSADGLSLYRAPTADA
jgi:hypothetical protein